MLPSPATQSVELPWAVSGPVGTAPQADATRMGDRRPGLHSLEQGVRCERDALRACSGELAAWRRVEQWRIAPRRDCPCLIVSRFGESLGRSPESFFLQIAFIETIILTPMFKWMSTAWGYLRGQNAAPSPMASIFDEQQATPRKDHSEHVDDDRRRRGSVARSVSPPQRGAARPRTGVGRPGRGAGAGDG
eukprot:COSAG06_NODE_7982_length_2312_cov_2.288748_1_plen_190_part_10